MNLDRIGSARTRDLFASQAKRVGTSKSQLEMNALLQNIQRPRSRAVANYPEFTHDPRMVGSNETKPGDIMKEMRVLIAKLDQASADHIIKRAYAAHVRAGMGDKVNQWSEMQARMEGELARRVEGQPLTIGSALRVQSARDHHSQTKKLSGSINGWSRDPVPRQQMFHGQQQPPNSELPADMGFIDGSSTQQTNEGFKAWSSEVPPTQIDIQPPKKSNPKAKVGKSETKDAKTEVKLAANTGELQRPKAASPLGFVPRPRALEEILGRSNQDHSTADNEPVALLDRGDLASVTTGKTPVSFSVFRPNGPVLAALAERVSKSNTARVASRGDRIQRRLDAHNARYRLAAAKIAAPAHALELSLLSPQWQLTEAEKTGQGAFPQMPDRLIADPRLAIKKEKEGKKKDTAKGGSKSTSKSTTVKRAVEDDTHGDDTTESGAVFGALLNKMNAMAEPEKKVQFETDWLRLSNMLKLMI